tara:strand:+ start:9820 stop:11739 length:1920 start_codon:yes stop_codon:yes gene_type:complete
MAEIKKDKGFDREAFKRAIAHVESSGGKYLDNKSSSAAGKYHFLYRYIQDIPLLRGVTKREFISRPELQEQVMDMAIDGTLPGFPSYQAYAKELQSKYRTNLDLHDIAALTHFLGKGGAKKYLSNPTGFVVPGKNASVQQYITKFRKAFGPNANKADQEGFTKTNPDEIGLNTKVQDKTAVAPKVIKEQKFDFQDSGRSYIDYLNNEDKYDQAPIEAEGTVQATEDAPVEDPAQDVAQDSAQVGQGTVLREPAKMLPLSADLDGITMEDSLSFLNTFAMGGYTNTHGAQDVIPIENGGTHEQNPYGGVPMGVGANGKMNTVEEGEVKFGDYIFSNRLSLGGVISGAKGGANQFAEGGDLDPTDPKKKESKKNDSNPITDPIFGPIPAEKDLEFTKSEMQTTPYGGLVKVDETFKVPDVREDYMIDNYVTTQKNDNVNFNLAINDKNALEFLSRYNNPWSRQKLAEQAGLRPEDIDNMILKGLNAKKEIGGEVVGSKASYDASKNKINMGSEFDGKSGVETHERVHASLFDAAQGENLMNVLGNPFQQEGRSFMKKHSPETVRYLKKPHEAYGNFVEFREKLGLKPGQQVTPEEVEKLVKKKGLEMENFYKVFNTGNITKALNTIAKVDSKPTMDEYRIA